MTFNIIKVVSVAAFVTVSSGAAFAGNSPFCFAGGPTPKHVCDAIKANQKPKAVLAKQNFKAQGTGQGRFNR